MKGKIFLLSLLFVLLISGLGFAVTCGSNLANATLPCDNDGMISYITENIEVQLEAFTGTVLEGDILSGDNWIFIDSASVANTPAMIYFNNIEHDKTLVPYRDGVICSESYCYNIGRTLDGSSLSFDVTGFSNYSYGWPECDEDLSNKTCVVNSDLYVNSGTYNDVDVIIEGGRIFFHDSVVTGNLTMNVFSNYEKGIRFYKDEETKFTEDNNVTFTGDITLLGGGSGLISGLDNTLASKLGSVVNGRIILEGQNSIFDVVGDYEIVNVDNYNLSNELLFTSGYGELKVFYDANNYSGNVYSDTVTIEYPTEGSYYKPKANINAIGTAFDNSNFIITYYDRHSLDNPLIPTNSFILYKNGVEYNDYVSLSQGGSPGNFKSVEVVLNESGNFTYDVFCNNNLTSFFDRHCKVDGSLTLLEDEYFIQKNSILLQNVNSVFDGSNSVIHSSLADFMFIRGNNSVIRNVWANSTIGNYAITTSVSANNVTVENITANRMRFYSPNSYYNNLTMGAGFIWTQGGLFENIKTIESGTCSSLSIVNTNNAIFRNIDWQCSDAYGDSVWTSANTPSGGLIFENITTSNALGFYGVEIYGQKLTNISVYNSNPKLLYVSTEDVYVENSTLQIVSIGASAVNVDIKHLFNNNYVLFDNIKAGTITFLNAVTNAVNWINVVTSSIFDTTATIQFEVDNPNYIPYKDGVKCEAECSSIVNDGSFLTFDVTGFSNYSYGLDSLGVDSVLITPNIISPQNEMVGKCTLSGGDDEYVTYYYRWYKNDVLVDSGNEHLAVGSTLSNAYGAVLTVDDEYVFSCQGDNGTMLTGFTNSSTKTILVNQLPVVYQTITTPVYDTESTLRGYCRATDTNEDDVVMDWILYREGIEYASGSLSSVAQNTNVLAVTISNESLLIEDEEWIMSCRADDGYNTTEYSNSSTVTILRNSRPPVLSYVRLHPIILFNDTVLSATALATDVNGDILTYNYTLYVNDIAVESDNDIKNNGVLSTGNFTYSTLNVSDEVKVGVVVSDIDYNIDEVFSLTFIVRDINNAPVISAVTTIPTVFISTINNIQGYCKATDADSDTVNFNYRWYKNGVVIASGTRTNSYLGFALNTDILVNTLPSSQTEPGDNITLSCQAFDAVDSGLWVNGTEQYIYSNENNAPTISSVNIVPTGSYNTLQSFNVTVLGEDINNHNIRFEWRYVKNGAYQPVSTSSYYTQGVTVLLATLPSSQTSAGDTWSVRVRVFDGVDYSSWSQSNTITITNTAPVMVSSQIVEGQYENDTLISSCSASDIDEQETTFQYRWYKDDELMATTTNLPYSYTQQGQEWIVSCRAFDGSVYSNWLNSSALTILDSSNIPIMQSVTLVGSNEEFVGTCKAIDFDGDFLDYSYIWSRNGIEYSSGTNLSVAQNTLIQETISPVIVEGDVWIFRCEASDTFDGSTGYVNSNSITVPTISFIYSISTVDSNSITVSWSTNADSVKVFVNNNLRTTTTLGAYKISSLLPDTTYEIKLVPVKNSFDGLSRIFNQSTLPTTGNAPTMIESKITPATIYTDTVIAGSCKGTDVESLKVFYVYNWKVNNVTVSSGTTSLQDRNTAISIGGLANTFFAFNDTISLNCQINDGTLSSAYLGTNITVSNNIHELSNPLVVNNISEFYCDYDFIDVDGDLEIESNFTWHKNNVFFSDNDTVLVTDVAPGDQIKCMVISSTDYHTVNITSSNYVVGDFNPPVLNIITMPTQAFTDTSKLIKAECLDDYGVAIGFPKITFINPNLVEQNYQLYFDSGITYQRYHTFPIAGYYTDIEFECKDGSGNTVIEQYEGSVLVQIRETVVNVGGGGGTVIIEAEPFRNITSFELNPYEVTLNMLSGSSIQREFEVINNDIVDIQFISAILENTNSLQTYNWIDFSNERKTIAFEVSRSGGLSSNNRFVRYIVTVPSGTQPGIYYGTIEVNGLDTAQQIELTINVREGFTLLGFLQTEIFELPFTREVTGAVVGAPDRENIPVTVGELLGTLLIIGVALFGYFRIRKQIKK